MIGFLCVVAAVPAAPDFKTGAAGTAATTQRKTDRAGQRTLRPVLSSWIALRTEDRARTCL